MLANSIANQTMSPATDFLTHEILLVGGGHTHVLFIKRLLSEPIKGLRCTLISDQIESPYSGMLPGHLSGIYSREEIHIDLSRLCHQVGVSFIRGKVATIDHQNKSVTLESGEELFFDILALDTGSRPTALQGSVQRSVQRSVQGSVQVAGGQLESYTLIGIKPIDSFLEFIRNLDVLLTASLHSPSRKIAIIGAGPAGCECAVALKLRYAGRVEVTLIQRSSRILPSLSWLARSQMLRTLKKLAVTIRLRQEAKPEVLALYDHCINATPPRPHPETSYFGLSQNQEGFLKIRPTLQSVDHEHIFVTGDLGSLGDCPFPKAGVYAVRQAPVLHENICRFMDDRPLKAFRPQARYLSLMLGGRERAILNWGPIGLGGAWLWRWKDKIDRRFMEMVNGNPHDTRTKISSGNESAPMQCFGCAAKVGALALAGGLKSLNRASAGIGEDFSRIAIGGSSLLQSVDFFPMFPFADDAWVTRVTLQHALNDLYVSGAKPQFLQMIAGLPAATSKINQRRLHRLLTATKEAILPLGIELIGGHTALTYQALLGFVVQGESQVPLWSKQGAQMGDSIILTKRLGSGVFLVAHRLGLIAASATKAFMSELPQSHHLAADILKSFSVHAATDISGFGMLGHLSDLLTPSLVARLNLSHLSLYQGIDQLLSICRSSAYPDNFAAFHQRIVMSGGIQDREAVLFDPQTAGPLCLILPKIEAQACQKALTCAGYPASIIGEIVGATDTPRLGPSEILIKGPI